MKKLTTINRKAELVADVSKGWQLLVIVASGFMAYIMVTQNNKIYDVVSAIVVFEILRHYFKHN